MTGRVLPPAMLRYSVETPRDGWELGEDTMPESVIHDEAVALIKAVLVAWAAGGGRRALIARNLAVRWDEDHPQFGVDPDVCVLTPPPPDSPDLRSVRTWVPGHAAPTLAIEVVSDANPRKDYVVGPEKYAASGTGELWIFDPLLCGPTNYGGPFRLQVWRRGEDGTLTRSYADAGPAYSPAVGGYVVVVDGGRKIRIADDPAGTQLWPTGEESERAAKEAALTAKEAERAAKEVALTAKEAERVAKEVALTAKEAALARITELERELGRRPGG